jgi:signal transduction histidine kinase
MRRQLIFTVAAVTTLVLVAFLLPLGYLVMRATADSAVSDAVLASQTLRSVVGTQPVEQVRLAVDDLNASGAAPTSVLLPGGTVLGADARWGPSVERSVRERRALALPVPGGRELLVPVFRTDGEVAVIRVLVPEERLVQGVERLWLALGGLGVTLLALAVVVADRLGRSFVRPTVSLAGVAERLSGGDLTSRAEPAGPPELREVAAALNRLAGRIRELLDRERESAADISHRLRTPLAVLRLEVDGLADPRERERLLEEVEGLEGMVTEIITAARRPVREQAPRRTDAVAVVRRRVEFWSVLAEDQGRDLELVLPEGVWPVAAGEDDLAAALDVLLENVLAHTPEGVPFEVRVEPGPDGTVRVTVRDSGPGFPDGGVVQRGATNAGRTGLGLDIARSTAAATGGGLSVSRSPTGGAQVVLELRPPAGRAAAPDTAPLQS